MVPFVAGSSPAALANFREVEMQQAIMCPFTDCYYDNYGTTPIPGCSTCPKSKRIDIDETFIEEDDNRQDGLYFVGYANEKNA